MRGARRRHFGLSLEPLEDRCVPTTVTTTLDVVDPNDGVVSLRITQHPAPPPATPHQESLRNRSEHSDILAALAPSLERARSLSHQAT